MGPVVPRLAMFLRTPDRGRAAPAVHVALA